MKPAGTVLLHVPVTPRFREELRARSHKTKTPMGRIIEAALQSTWTPPAPPSDVRSCPYLRGPLPLCPLEVD